MANRWKVAVTLQSILFLFEYLFWQLDTPWGSHSGLQQRISRNAFFLNVQINSVPHLLAAFIFWHRRSRLMLIYLGYLAFFTFMQCYFWWLPYFFNWGFFVNSPQILNEYLRLHAEDHRILPAFMGHAVVPDTEHTLLFPLSVATLVYSAVCVFEFYQTQISWLLARLRPAASAQSEKDKAKTAAASRPVTRSTTATQRKAK